MTKRDKSIIADIPRLLGILATNMVRSRTMAIRELVQNAVGSGADQIRISLDHQADRLALNIIDNGIGMSESDVDEYLLCIASGVNPIGMFGMGFFSSLGISNEVHVYTRKQREQALHLVFKVGRLAGICKLEELSCRDLDEAGVAAAGIETRGTSVRLYDPVADDGTTPLASRDIADVIYKWLRFCPVPILLNDERLTTGMVIEADPQQVVNLAFSYENGRKHGLVTGVVGLDKAGTKAGTIEVLKHHILIDRLPRLNLCGVVNCDALDVTMQRDGAIRDEVWRQVGLAVDGVVPALAKIVAERPNPTELESQFLHQCIKEWLEGNDPQAFSDPFKSVPLFKTIFGTMLSLGDIETAISQGHRVYMTYAMNDRCQNLLAQGDLVVHGEEAGLEKALIALGTKLENVKDLEHKPAEMAEPPRDDLAAVRYLFVSYAREDAEVVLPIVEVVRQEFRSRATGVELWVDVDRLTPGQQWDIEIVRALGKSVGLLVFVSSAAMRFDWVSRAVASTADEQRDQLVIPVIIENVPNLSANVPARQWLDLSVRREPAELQLAAQQIADVTEAHLDSENAKPPVSASEAQAIAAMIAEQARNARRPDVGEEEPPRSVFLVHGHDGVAIAEVEAYLAELGIKAFILSRVQGPMQSLLQKFFKSAADARFAIVILSPDDFGVSCKEYFEEGVGDRALQFRARQNVILELGFFYGLLGWEHVFVLHRPPEKIHPHFEWPSDIQGAVFDRMDASGAWRESLAAKLVEAGFALTGRQPRR